MHMHFAKVIFAHIVIIASGFVFDLNKVAQRKAMVGSDYDENSTPALSQLLAQDATELENATKLADTETAAMEDATKLASRETAAAPPPPDGWYDGGIDKSCDEGCAAVNLVCSERGFYDHVEEVDSAEEMEAVVRSIGLYTSSPCKASLYKDVPVWIQGLNPSPESVEYNKPGKCYYANPEKTLDAFLCSKSPGGTIFSHGISENKRRLCYCHSPQSCEDLKTEGECNDAAKSFENSGRSMFCSWNGVSCELTPNRAECQKENLFHISERGLSQDNLGGKGPNYRDQEILEFADVFPDSGSTITLFISVLKGEYFPHNNHMNGALHGSTFGNINMAHNNSRVVFEFKFKDKFHVPVTPPGKWFLTIADLDMEDPESGTSARELAAVPDAISYHFSYKTTMRVAQENSTDDDGIVDWKIKSTAFGDRHDNPWNQCDLTTVQAARTVSFLMPEDLSSFKVAMYVKKGDELPMGRNFGFGGATNVVCSREELKKAWDIRCIDTDLPLRDPRQPQPPKTPPTMLER